MDCGSPNLGLDVFLSMVLALSATAFSWQLSGQKDQHLKHFSK